MKKLIYTVGTVCLLAACNNVLVEEKFRWYDLKRTGKLLERVRKYNLDAATNIREFHVVRPVPQTQIDRVSNPGDSRQNEGY
ncbi:MAG: hypothetical protein ABS46_13310 [Cytophagaceae bacterium SCN 52-12]|nr:MAG: hypothetical protein ABS46_13310 [Cytophagaceae bacterium SCN 52-12]